MKSELFIAKRISSSNGRIAGFSNKIAVFSIAVSIFVMLIAVAVSSGFNREIRGTISGLTGDFFLTSPGEDLFEGSVPLPSDLSVVQEIASVEGVERVTPFIYSAGVLKNGDRIEGLLLKGVDSSYTRSFYERALVSGDLPAFTSDRASDEILISKRMSERTGLEVGEKALVYFIGDRTRLRQFRVCGIYNAVLDDLDEKLVLVDLRVLQRLNGWKSEVSGFEVICSDRVDDVHSLDGEVERILSTSGNGELLPGYPDDTFPFVYDWLNMLDNNLILVLVLMLIVAAFNMVSSLLIMLFEKISMIGILKSLGMADRGIVRVFLLKASMLLAKGFLIGNAGAAVVMLVLTYVCPIPLDPVSYFVDAVPFHVSVEAWLGLNLISFVLMQLILLLPLLLINRVNPAMTVKMK